MKVPSIAAGLLLALAAGSARAQVESPLVSRLQLNFSNPGGKSLAMGGAFVSLADDATAAFANPAGLAKIVAWDVGISGKRFSFQPSLASANLAVDPTVAGYKDLGLSQAYKPSDSTNELEFLSVAAPITESLSFAVYRAVNLSYGVDAANGSIGPFQDYRLFNINLGPSDRITLDEQGAVSMKNEVYGLSLGWNLGAVSVGAGVTLNKLTFDMTGGSAYGAHTFVYNRGRNVGDGNDESRVDVSTTVTSGSRLGWNAGFRWQIDERLRLNVGGVYRANPSFDVDYQMRYYAPGKQGSTYTCATDPTQCGQVKLPDDYSIGASIQPFRFLTLALDVQRVRYSQLNRSFVPVFAYSGCAGAISLQACNADPTKKTRAITQGSSSDVTIPRAGLELNFPISSSTLFLRGGYYGEPAHNTTISLAAAAPGSRVPGAPVQVQAPPISAAFDLGTNSDLGTENHATFGAGLSLGRNFSVDLAADLGATNTAWVLSAFYRFR